jgi:hypothetical protein
MVSGVNGPSGRHVTTRAEEGRPQELETVHLQCREEDSATAKAEMKKFADPILDAEVLLFLYVKFR